MPDPDALRCFKAEIFQALAHPTRIAIVEALRDRELSAGKLIELLELEQANASQHLAVLRSRQIVVSRREGNQVFYALRDSALSEVLAIMRRYFKRHIAGARVRLTEIGRQEARDR
jgi:DNA-binding transcriptional ArsR family regulator